MKRVLIGFLLLTAGCHGKVTVQPPASAGLTTIGYEDWKKALVPVGANQVEAFALETMKCVEKFETDLEKLKHKARTEEEAHNGLERTINVYGGCMEQVSDEFGL